MSKNLFLTDFMDKLGDKLKTERELSDASIKLYLRQLTLLNDNESFKNLNFLKNVNNILDKLKDYKENTKKSYLSAIEAVLSTQKKNKQSLKLYDTYKNMLEEKKKDYNNKDKNETNDKEEKNWVSMDDINKIKTELLEGLSEKKNNQRLTLSEYKRLLKAFILSLYTDLPPRRNQDYLLCFITKNNKLTDKTNMNYLLLKDNKFIFNRYKTAKSGGQQEIDFSDNEPFKNVLSLYLKHHPHLKSSKGLVPLLVDERGVPPTSPNWITRILNNIFKKKVGSSMLRKIYLTTKYGDQLDKLKEMRTTAKAMGHNPITAQSVYIKDKEV